MTEYEHFKTRNGGMAAILNAITQQPISDFSEILHGKQNRTAIEVIQHKLQISTIQDGGRPPF